MKLVRNRIPELAGAGQPVIFYQATEAEYGRLLRAKLLEEAAEAAGACGPAELLEELGDVLQVLYALASQAGLEPAAIECARARKARSRGAFSRRVVCHDPRPRGRHLHRRRRGRLPGRRRLGRLLRPPHPALAGQALADAQAILARWDDPDSPQGGLGDCWGCVANVARLRALIHQATQPTSPEGGPR